MIRIKCPKCSSTLTLDDAQAGQVGQCPECEAKFRVPARKAAAPARAAKDDEEKRRPPSRERDDEDDDQDEADDQDGQPRQSPQRRKSKGLSESARYTLVVSGGFLIAIIALGTGGIFIPRLALIVTGVSVLLMLTFSLMMAREAWADGMAKFMMVWLIPLYLFYFVSENWGRTQRLFIPYVGFLVLAVVSAYAVVLQDERLDEKRKATKAKIDHAVTAIVRVYRDA